MTLSATHPATLADCGVPTPAEPANPAAPAPREPRNAGSTGKLYDTDLRAKHRGAAPAKKAKYADGGGLVLWHMPSGGMLWRFRYRVSGAERELAFGTYPDVGLAAARAKRDAARSLVAAGLDPAEERKKAATAARALATFRDFAEETKAARLAGKSEVTADKWEGHLKAAIEHFGDTPLAEITAAACYEFLREWERAGKLDTLKSIRQKMSAVFRRGMLAGACAGDPTQALKGELRYPPRSKGRPAITRSPERFGELLKAIDARRGDPAVTAALQFLALTFQRPHMVRAMKWSEVNWSAKLWEVDAERMKGEEGQAREHVVPLSAQALAVLKFMWPISGGLDRDGLPRELVFPGRFPGETMSENTLATAINRAGFKGEHCAHGFRATANTMLKERCGYARDQELIDIALAHVIASETRAAYDRVQFLDERRAMFADWANYLDTLRAGGDVVAFKVAA